MIALSGYQIIDRIYSGTRTLVDRGTRLCDQKPVAIKVLRNEYPSFSEHVQFRNQYTIVKNLNLPGILQTYSLQAYRNGYALIVQDFGGISLKEWTGKGKTVPSLVEFFQIAIGLSNTLDILNRHRTIIADGAIIVFTDACDVLCIRYDPAGLAADFSATGRDLIVAAETVFCHHSADVLPFFLSNYLGYPAKYLNSGFIIGYKSAYLRMLNYIASNFVDKYMTDCRQNDQRVISRFMLENSELGLLNVDIDSTFKFCYTHT